VNGNTELEPRKIKVKRVGVLKGGWI
jgi:hypothetical protein